jgi:hypothetical protein
MADLTDHLDGTLLEYTYDALGTVRVTFKTVRVGFEWLAGPLQGEKGEGFEYRALRLGDQQFFVNWHEPDVPGFVTIVYDLANGTACSSVLAAYGTEAEQRFFETATINRVERL